MTVGWNKQVGGGKGLWRIKLPNQEVSRILGRRDRPEKEPPRESGPVSRAYAWPAGNAG